MKGNFIYWAQALDNTSPDHIEAYGQTLSTDDTLGRQDAVSTISSVVKVGTRIYDQQGIQLTYDRCRFVIEVPTTERDHAGRIAPIICCGEYDLKNGDKLGALITFNLDAFAKRIGRNIRSEHNGLIQESFIVLKKKSLSKKLVMIVVTGIGILFLLSLAYWLITMGSAKNW